MHKTRYRCLCSGIRNTRIHAYSRWIHIMPRIIDIRALENSVSPMAPAVDARAVDIKALEHRLVPTGDRRKSI